MVRWQKQEGDRLGLESSKLQDLRTSTIHAVSPAAFSLLIVFRGEPHSVRSRASTPSQEEEYIAQRPLVHTRRHDRHDTPPVTSDSEYGRDHRLRPQDHLSRIPQTTHGGSSPQLRGVSRSLYTWRKMRPIFLQPRESDPDDRSTPEDVVWGLSACAWRVVGRTRAWFLLLSTRVFPVRPSARARATDEGALQPGTSFFLVDSFAVMLLARPRWLTARCTQRSLLASGTRP